MTCVESAISRISVGEEDGAANIFELVKNEAGEDMLKHIELGDNSPAEIRENQSVNGRWQY